MARAKKAAAPEDRVTVDPSPKVILRGGGPRDGEGFTLADWKRITTERAEWALLGRGRADWLDYKLTDETEDITTVSKDGKSRTVRIYQVARYSPKGSR
jgi:hypothetical protein